MALIAMREREMQSSKGRKKTTKRIGTGYMMVKRLSKTSKTLIGKKKKNPTYLPYFFQPCYLKQSFFFFWPKASWYDLFWSASALSTE